MNREYNGQRRHKEGFKDHPMCTLRSHSTVRQRPGPGEVLGPREKMEGPLPGPLAHRGAMEMSINYVFPTSGDESLSNRPHSDHLRAFGTVPDYVEQSVTRPPKLRKKPAKMARPSQDYYGLDIEGKNQATWEYPS